MPTSKNGYKTYLPILELGSKSLDVSYKYLNVVTEKNLVANLGLDFVDQRLQSHQHHTKWCSITKNGKCICLMRHTSKPNPILVRVEFTNQKIQSLVELAGVSRLLGADQLTNDIVICLDKQRQIPVRKRALALTFPTLTSNPDILARIHVNSNEILKFKTEKVMTKPEETDIKESATSSILSLTEEAIRSEAAQIRRQSVAPAKLNQDKSEKVEDRAATSELEAEMERFFELFASGNDLADLDGPSVINPRQLISEGEELIPPSELFPLEKQRKESIILLSRKQSIQTSIPLLQEVDVTALIEKAEDAIEVENEKENNPAAEAQTLATESKQQKRSRGSQDRNSRRQTASSAKTTPKSSEVPDLLLKVAKKEILDGFALENSLFASRNLLPELPGSPLSKSASRKKDIPVDQPKEVFHFGIETLKSPKMNRNFKTIIRPKRSIIGDITKRVQPLPAEAIKTPPVERSIFMTQNPYGNWYRRQFTTEQERKRILAEQREQELEKSVETPQTTGNLYELL